MSEGKLSNKMRNWGNRGRRRFILKDEQDYFLEFISEAEALERRLAEAEKEQKITKKGWTNLSDDLRNKVRSEQDKIRTASELVNSAYKDEVEIVRAVCHNYMGEMLKEEKLQETVIFHLRNFKSNLGAALRGNSDKE